jgi:hypothetical protein
MLTQGHNVAATVARIKQERDDQTRSRQGRYRDNFLPIVIKPTSPCRKCFTRLPDYPRAGFLSMREMTWAFLLTP